MNIGKSKGIRRTFLGVKADGKPLYHANIVNRAFLVKIGQRNVPLILIYFIGVIGVGIFCMSASPFS